MECPAGWAWASVGRVLHPSYPLKTERLLLRPITDDDFDDLFAFQSDPEVARYVLWETRTEATMRAALAKKVRDTALEREGDQLSLAVVAPPDDTVIGEVNLVWASERHGLGELGYVFHRGYHGRGYGFEAAREVLRVAFEEAGLHRVIARCDARNTASWRLMAKLGMRREACFVRNEIFKGEWSDELVYAMLAEEWPPAEA